MGDHLPPVLFDHQRVAADQDLPERTMDEFEEPGAVGILVSNADFGGYAIISGNPAKDR